MHNEDFLPVADHFEALVQRLAQEDQQRYRQLRNTRVETAYRNRSFVVYEIRRREPEIIDQLTVLDFSCDEELGASTEIRSEKKGSTLIVGYSPVRLWNYDAYMHLPLHCKVRWSTSPGQIEKGSLAFPLCVRTASRLHLRERGVTYVETGVSYAKEFETAAA